MPDPAEKIDPVSHPLWNPVTATRREINLMRIARKRARIAGVCMILSVGLGIYAAVQHVSIISKPQTFIGILPSGWLFSGQPKRLRLSEEQIEDTWKQIIEAHFARTEKGALPDLSDFSTPDTLKDINKLLSRNSDSSYMVSFTIVEDRIVAKTSAQAILHVRGRLTVVDRQKTASSEVFLTTFFQRGSATYQNITGWRLAGLKKLERDEFYAKERAAVRDIIFGAKAKTPGSE